MITPAERVMSAVDENYMTLPNRTQTMATEAVLSALKELLNSLGWCAACWGRGYLLDGVGEPENAPERPLPETAEVTTCPYCERGKALERIVADDLFAHPE